MPLLDIQLLDCSGCELFNFFVSLFLTLTIALIPIFLAFALVSRS